MSFVRVRSADLADPQHVFDAPVRLVERFPDAYVVVDAVPVDKPRPVEYVGPNVGVLHAGEMVLTAADVQAAGLTAGAAFRRRKKK